MPRTFRNARMIAEEKNDASKFGSNENYNAVEGVPNGTVPARGQERNYAANPTNPPEKPLPVKNLKR